MFKFTDLDQHKQLLSLAVPMILSNITVPLLGLVDTAVIGHLPHAYFLGGSTIGAMIITSIIWLCGFLRMSTTGLSAQAFGEHDINKNILVLLRGLAVAFIVGLSLVILQVPLIEGVLAFAGGSTEVQLYAHHYSETRIWGLPAALANLVILGWLLGNHKAKTVMWILIVTNLVNVVLDLLFVFSFGWQVKGVALATVVAEYSGMMLGLFVIANHYKQALQHLFTDTYTSAKVAWLAIFERMSLLAYFKLNRDILIRTLCLEICFIFITFQGARLGDEVVAANAILMNFLLLISFGLDGIANATEALVGKAKGLNNRMLLVKNLHIALLWTGVFALFYSLLFAVAGEFLLTLISDIPVVVNFAKDYLFWMILLPVVGCWCYLFDGVYIGLMQAKAMRNSMIIAVFAAFFPLWFLLKGYGNHGLWAAFLLFLLARGATLVWHFYNRLLPVLFTQGISVHNENTDSGA